MTDGMSNPHRNRVNVDFYKTTESMKNPRRLSYETQDDHVFILSLLIPPTDPKTGLTKRILLPWWIGWQKDAAFL